MTSYLINGDRVMAHTIAPVKTPHGSHLIHSEREIESSDLTASQLAAIWNTLPEVTPIVRFKDRKTAARRLWAAFQKIAPSSAKPSVQREKDRAGTKQNQVIALLHQQSGATIDDLVEATKWQPHTVRGMIAGTLKKKFGLDVISERTERGRVYRINEEASKRAA